MGEGERGERMGVPLSVIREVDVMAPVGERDGSVLGIVDLRRRELMVEAEGVKEKKSLDAENGALEGGSDEKVWEDWELGCEFPLSCL